MGAAFSGLFQTMLEQNKQQAAPQQAPSIAPPVQVAQPPAGVMPQAPVDYADQLGALGLLALYNAQMSPEQFVRPAPSIASLLANISQVK